MEEERENSETKQSNRIDYSTRWQVVGFYECCKNQEETANYFGIHQASVSRILSKFQVLNDVADYKKVGRYDILTAEDEDTIKGMIEENRYITSNELAQELDVSQNTILKKLSQLGIKYSLPTEIPQLNSMHISKRLEHVTNLKEKKLNNIVFVDESYLQLYRNTLGCWNFMEEQNFKNKPQQRVCLMVFAAINWNGKSEIHLYDEGFKINSESYCKILGEILIPFTNSQFQKGRKTRNSQKINQWYLIQDNAPSHLSNFTQQFLIDNQIETLKHPPNSPDLNPIELVWVILKHKVEKQKPKTEKLSSKQQKSNGNQLNNNKYKIVQPILKKEQKKFLIQMEDTIDFCMIFFICDNFIFKCKIE